MSTARSLSLFFAAGALGGLVNSLAVWLGGQLGLHHALGVALAPTLAPVWLYRRVVWGGLWGFSFVLPLRSGWLTRGLWLSLGPSLAQLFVVFPTQTDHGVGGIGLGVLTPVFVLLYNAIWGLTASWWLKGTAGGS